MINPATSTTHNGHSSHGVPTDDKETRRLDVLRDLGILDTAPEQEFDDLVQLASQICNTPISLVSLIDSDRQWFKATHGTGLSETPRDYSFCSHAIEQEGLFMIEDATNDRRFRDNPLVTADPHIRFYAGIPLQAAEEVAVGTLCVIDTVPRTLSPGQQNALRILARQVQARLELRTERKKIEKVLFDNERLSTSLKNSNDNFRAFMDNGPFVSYVKDHAGKMIFYNAGLANRFGVDREAWLGQTDHDLWPKEMADDMRRHDLEVINGKTSVQFVETSPNIDDSITQWKSYKFPIENEVGVTMLAGISIDITEELKREAELKAALQALSRSHAELESLASLDSLTGLFNRRIFQQRMRDVYSVAKRKSRPLAAVVLDIDNFKQRNDEFGHQAGDDALRALGAILGQLIRAGDVAARIGGEEFGILLPETTTQEAHALAQRLQQRLASLAFDAGPITVSIGIDMLNDEMLSGDQLLSNADKAMYEAKCLGKNQIVTFAEATKTT